MNYVTQDELKQAQISFLRMSDDEVDQIRDSMAEQTFERLAAFGGTGELASCIVEETGEPVSMLIYEIIYSARVTKLFEERNNA